VVPHLTTLGVPPPSYDGREATGRSLSFYIDNTAAERLGVGKGF
jgi:hypothetical protein